ncbi:MAG TPA: class I SAM-dependent methyltransferase [Candidatus Tectomicrobia bacterium]
MEAGRPSITALHAAFMRAHHDAHARPTIFAHTYAHLMLSASERESIEARLLDDLHRVDPALAQSCPDRQAASAVAMQALPSPAHIIVRARYAEDTLAEAMPRGLRSYVIIGAARDIFALRHPELHGQLLVVELDHPATQAFKRQRLAEVGLPPWPGVPCL